MRHCYFLILVGFAFFSCNSEAVLPELRFSSPRITERFFDENSLFLKWNIEKNSEEILGYRVSYGIVAGSDEGAINCAATAIDTGCTMGNLQKGQRYFAQVQAVYYDFFGPWSEFVNGVTGQPAPVKRLAVNRNKNASGDFVLDLAWEDDASNAKRSIEGYVVSCWETADENNKTKDLFINKKPNTQTYAYTVQSSDLKIGYEAYTCSMRVRMSKNILSDKITSASRASSDVVFAFKKPVVERKFNAADNVFTITPEVYNAGLVDNRTIEYKISPENAGVVVTTDTGQVTVSSIGEFTVTAQKAANGQHQQASTQYTLKITNPEVVSIHSERLLGSLSSIAVDKQGNIYAIEMNEKRVIK